MNKLPDGRVYEDLPLDEQHRYLQERPLPERAELMLLSRSPGRLVSSISDSELLFITKQTDRSETIELIRHATVSQLVFLTDYNAWRGDSLDSRRFFAWFSDLLEMDVDRFTQVLRHVDYETLVAAFKKCLEVFKTRHEEMIDEMVGDEPFFTLDHLYYFKVFDEENFRTVKLAIETVFERDKPFYFELVEGILSESDLEIEELAYESREERLSEKGFPTKEEAFRIYRPLAAGEFAARERKTPEPGGAQEDGAEKKSAGLHLPAVVETQRLLLDEALAVLSARDPGAGEGISRELLGLTNKVLVCRGAEPTAPVLQECTLHVRSYISLGLDELGGGGAEAAAGLLSGHWLEDIFRVGYGCVDRARQRLMTMLRRHWQGDLRRLTAYLGSPCGEWVEKLAPRHPALPDGRGGFRDPASRQDARAIDEMVGKLDALLGLLARRGFLTLGRIVPEPGARKGRKKIQYNFDPQTLTLHAALGSALVHWDTDGVPAAAPVDKARWAAFLARRTGADGAWTLEEARRRAFEEALLEGESEATRHASADMLTPLLDFLDRECRGARLVPAPDPRYVAWAVVEV